MKNIESVKVFILLIIMVLLFVMILQNAKIIGALPMSYQQSIGQEDKAEFQAPIVRPIFPSTIDVRVVNTSTEDIPVTVENPVNVDLHQVDVQVQNLDPIPVQVSNKVEISR